MLQQASIEERKRYYAEEWSQKELPDFIADTIKNREFGFDHDGSGPSDRYNCFYTAQQLESFLKARAPYAAYSSISLYEKPGKREGWLKAELVFDIDAKDLPVKRCRCEAGAVCEVCLEDAKEFVFLVSDVLRDDFNLKNIRYVYSGRGYHIRVLDEEIARAGGSERGHILEYVSGSVVPSTAHMKFKLGYPRVFKERLLKFLQLVDEERLKSIVGKSRAEKLAKEKRRMANEIEEGNLKPLELALGRAAYAKFIESVRMFNAGMLDGKVTVDVKRILRLPSSLHSGVSMKCMEVKDIKKFSPLSDAVPKFVGERNIYLRAAEK